MQIKLSKEEFCLFSDATKLIILDAEGRLICVRRINEELEIRIYYLFEFLVEMIFEYENEHAVKIAPFTGSVEYLNYLKQAP